MHQKTNKISRERLSRTLADRLQERIIADGLEPGARLPTEPSLMDAYGVSRTVVREAAAILQSRGLVDVRPRHGMTVRAADSSALSEPITALLRAHRVSAEQLIEVRTVLETAIARSAALSRTEEDVRQLRACLEEAAHCGHDQMEALRLDMAFHERLVEATHNPFYLMVTAPVSDLLRQMYELSFGYLAMQPDTLEEHRAIFEAVADQDVERAEQAVAAHLSRVTVGLREIVEQLPEDDAYARPRH